MLIPDDEILNGYLYDHGKITTLPCGDVNDINEAGDIAEHYTALPVMSRIKGAWQSGCNRPT